MNAFLIQIRILLMGFVLITTSCNNKKESSGSLVQKANHLDWPLADSAELIFFPDPANQKNYTVQKWKDANLMSWLNENLTADSMDGKECPHSGKIYLFAQGEVFKTLYLSVTCNYLAFIVNGKPFYKKLDLRLKQKWMESLKGM